MAERAREVLADALALSDDERRDLAEQLVSSLSADPEWLAELERRARRAVTDPADGEAWQVLKVRTRRQETSQADAEVDDEPMSVAEKIGRANPGRLSWAEIGTMHPNEWVYLCDVEDAIDGSIGSARVVAHDPSMRQLLAQLGSQPSTDAVVVHTWGRPLRSPRIEMTDEIRDIVPARR